MAATQANIIEITVTGEAFSYQAQTTSATDVFKFSRESLSSAKPSPATPISLAEINLSGFAAGNQVDLSNTSSNGFNADSLGITQPADVSIIDTNLQVTLIDAPNPETINTWVITFAGVNQQIINAVESAANPQAAFANITDIWHEGWIILS